MKIFCFLFGHKCDDHCTGYDGWRDCFFWVCHICESELDIYEAHIKAGFLHDIWLRLVSRFRDIFPEKCSACGHRYKCDESVDHIPF